MSGVRSLVAEICGVLMSAHGSLLNRCFSVGWLIIAAVNWKRCCVWDGKLQLARLHSPSISTREKPDGILRFPRIFLDDDNPIRGITATRHYVSRNEYRKTYAVLSRAYLFSAFTLFQLGRIFSQTGAIYMRSLCVSATISVSRDSRDLHWTIIYLKVVSLQRMSCGLKWEKRRSPWSVPAGYFCTNCIFSFVAFRFFSPFRNATD